MSELQTYCEACGNTYAAHFNTLSRCVVLSCGPCDTVTGILDGSRFTALSASQQKEVHRLLERTAQKEGNEVPPLVFQTTETQQGGSLYGFKPSVFTPLELSAKDEEWLLLQRYLLQQLCTPGESWETFCFRALGVPASELGAGNG